MDLKHKHHALIVTFLLILVFIVIIAWFALKQDAPLVVLPAPVASTTPPLPPIMAVPVKIQESNRFYDITATYPSATPLADGANTAAVAMMKQFIQDSIAQFKKDGIFDTLTAQDIAMIFQDDRKYALDITYKTYTGRNTVSYVYVLYENTLGAHPNANYRTFTFDTATGNALATSDLFLPNTQYLTTLSARARTDIPRIIAKQAGSDFTMDQTMLNDGTAPKAENFQWFRIEGDILVLIFPPYQVGPYVIGTVEVPIPLQQLSASLAPAYRP